MRYRPEIDGLRAVAVIPVILFHAGFSAVAGGYLGVDVFLVISGYLITSILIEGFESGDLTLAAFYANRIRRLLPALVVMLLGYSLSVGWLMRPAELVGLGKIGVAVATFSSNIAFWRWSGYFDGPSAAHPLLHTWSLGLEEQFYLVFPLALLTLWRAGRRATWVTLICVGLVSLIGAELVVSSKPDFAFFLLPCRAWEFLAGALVAAVPARWRDADRRSLWAEAGTLLGLSLIVVPMLTYTSATPDPSVWTVLPVMGACLVLAYSGTSRILNGLLGSAVPVAVGMASYGAYLWHQPIIVVTRALGADTSRPLPLIGVLLATAVAAAASTRLIERPTRDKRRFSDRQVFWAGGAATATIISLGAVTIATDGFLGRFAAQDRELASIDARSVGEWVPRRFTSLKDAAFIEGPRPRILIIGDSYAQDLVDMLAESGSLNDLQLSTHAISRRCGNLFVSGSLLPYLQPGDVNRCKRDGWYTDPVLQRRMREADEVWLASFWAEWTLPFIQPTIRNIETLTGKRVLIFGSKSFGRVDVRRLLNLAPEARLRAMGVMEPEVSRVNAAMRAQLPDAQFVDLVALAGARGDSVPQFSPNGHLVSVDGRHLTRAGAALLGERLRADPRLALLFRAKDQGGSGTLAPARAAGDLSPP
jgi:peptidoglycan/LPS O-acetylase OafA/YrhL